MALNTVKELVDELRQAALLDDAQLATLEKHGPKGEARLAARFLIQRDWLTPFQVNQIFQGQTKELTLGPYQLIDRLGKGAMGTVFKARHFTMGRLTALKVIRKDKLSHPKAVKRFQQEIRAAAQLSHPHVVIAYNADQVNGTHYYAMEYVDGIDLARRVERDGPLPVRDACTYIMQAALGLQHAHERGLVHRDIKPANLLLTKDGRGVKVLDMGLARLQEIDDDGAHLTAEGVLMGTPDYLAPEQARNSHATDIRADLYSLGCTFYYLLAGHIPFPADTLTAKLFRHYSDPPPDVQEVCPEATAEVAQIIQRLMAKRPEDRYPTPGVLAYDLESLLTTGPLALSESKQDWLVQHIPPPTIPVNLNGLFNDELATSNSGVALAKKRKKLKGPELDSSLSSIEFKASELIVESVQEQVREQELPEPMVSLKRQPKRKKRKRDYTALIVVSATVAVMTVIALAAYAFLRMR